WSLPEGEAQEPLPAAHDGAVLALAYDGDALLSLGQDGSVFEWIEGQPPQELLPPGQESVHRAAFAGRSLALAYDDGRIELWDLESATFTPVSAAAPVPLKDLSCNGLQVAAGYGDDSVQVWDLQDLAAPRSWAQEEKRAIPVTQVAYSPDGSTLVSGGYNGTLIVWDVASGQALQQLFTPPSMIQDVAIDPSGRLLASAHCAQFDAEKFCAQGKVVLWDLQTGEILRELPGHAGFVQSVAFSPQDDLLASGGCGNSDVGGSCQGGEVILWDLSSSETISRSLVGHSNVVLTAAFSPDGGLLASAGEDWSIVLWDTASGEQVGQRLTGHPATVRSVEFSPDGSLLASAGYGRVEGYRYIDGAILLWDVASGRRLGQAMITQDGYAYDLAYHPNGREIFVLSGRGNISRWEVDVELWRERACRLANRSLTQQEWAQFFGEDAYRETCSGR
ncbi:MAG: WD40 repeat domain-containing protein, partial [Chloroflexia bacterium]|nr:WD40 repeat domain-containing protein [Chloroflexia bacterium]